MAQQQANAALQRSAWASSQAQNRRELAQLRAQADEAAAQWQRQRDLAASGFVSPAGLEQAERQARLAAQLLAQAREDQQLEQRTRSQSLAEMDRAVAGLQQGLRLLQASREQWGPARPSAGRLSGFACSRARVCAPANTWPASTTRRRPAAGGRGGRVLPAAPQRPARRLQRSRHLDADPNPAPGAGRQGTRDLPGRGHKAPVLRPGQTVELRLQLGEARPALLLPEGPGLQDRVYVRQGDELQRRPVQLGRRAAGLVEVLAGLEAGDQV